MAMSSILVQLGVWLFSKASSTEGIVASLGMFTVLYHFLFSMQSSAVTRNHPPHGSSASRPQAMTTLLSMNGLPTPIKWFLTVTLLGIFVRWPLTSILLVTFWCSVLYSYYCYAFTTPSIATATSASSTVSSASSSSSTLLTMMPSLTVSSLPAPEPWMILVAFLASWTLCALIADCLETYWKGFKHIVRQAVYKTVEMIVWRIPRALVVGIIGWITNLCKLLLVRILWRGLIRPVVHVVNNLTRWVVMMVGRLQQQPQHHQYYPDDNNNLLEHHDPHHQYYYPDNNNNNRLEQLEHEEEDEENSEDEDDAYVFEEMPDYIWNPDKYEPEEIGIDNMSPATRRSGRLLSRGL